MVSLTSQMTKTDRKVLIFVRNNSNQKQTQEKIHKTLLCPNFPFHPFKLFLRYVIKLTRMLQEQFISCWENARCSFSAEQHSQMSRNVFWNRKLLIFFLISMLQLGKDSMLLFWWMSCLFNILFLKLPLHLNVWQKSLKVDTFSCSYKHFHHTSLITE